MCLSPLKRSYLEDGSSVLGEHRKAVRSVPLPCGVCILCKEATAKEWFVRLYSERHCHKEAFALTLTYAPEHLPRQGVWSARDLILFAKRVRKAHGDGLRFYVAGEYSPTRFRPHYHGVVYGWFPKDARRYAYDSKGSLCSWRSSELTELWGKCDKGALVIQEFSPGVAKYVCGHVTAKLLQPVPAGWDAPPSYKSRGLGRGFYERFRGQLLGQDRIAITGPNAYGVPRFFDKLTEAVDPVLLAELKAQREFRAASSDYRDPERVQARALMLESQLRAKARAKLE